MGGGGECPFRVLEGIAKENGRPRSCRLLRRLELNVLDRETAAPSQKNLSFGGKRGNTLDPVSEPRLHPK